MNWPLNINNFTFLDRLKISKFVLDPRNRWTQGDKVKEFESKMAEYVGCNYAVFVSSGSTANTLLADYQKSIAGDKDIVVLPSTTWQTSCSPWIKAGFKPKFIDVNLLDFSMDRHELDKFLSKNSNKVACVFPTSLIGFTPKMDDYKWFAKQYKVNINFDNCENTFGTYNGQNVSSFFTSTTSTYFGHQIQSIEGGFIFTNSKQEYEYFLINRNHGMVRSLDAYGIDATLYQNNKVDGLFDFYSLGNNFRNSDLNAFVGMLDFKRVQLYKKSRKKLYEVFKNKLDLSKFYLPNESKHSLDIPFCLPIISKEGKKEESLKICQELGIEYRPIISGYLGYQTCYKEFFDSEDNYQNSINLHENGFYVGLFHKLSESKIEKLVDRLNNI
jgi:CDP-4-dehydro-6-deoxyglucose reductase, E1